MQPTYKALPFISGTINILQQGLQTTTFQVYGSYARTAYTGDEPTYYTTIVPARNTSNALGLTTTPSFLSDDNQWQTGAQVGVWNKRLTVDYNYEIKNFGASFYVEAPTSTYTAENSPDRSKAHRIRIAAVVIKEGPLQWQSALTMASIKNRAFNMRGQVFMHSLSGDVNSPYTSWTGGFTNKFTWQQFTAGINLVYFVSRETNPQTVEKEKVKALELQNLYISYTINGIKGTQALGVFADLRGQAQHRTFTIADDRIYYSLGARVSM